MWIPFVLSEIFKMVSKIAAIWRFFHISGLKPDTNAIKMLKYICFLIQRIQIHHCQTSRIETPIHKAGSKQSKHYLLCIVLCTNTEWEAQPQDLSSHIRPTPVSKGLWGNCCLQRPGQSHSATWWVPPANVISRQHWADHDRKRAGRAVAMGVCQRFSGAYAHRSCLLSSNACSHSDLVGPHLCTAREVRLGKSDWHLGNLYQDIVDQDEDATQVNEDETLREFQQFFTHHLEQAATQSRTEKLWVQYINQVFLMLNFRAERAGNWKFHLHCVQEMIPHFHAAGHLPYAKSARLYLKQMNSIQQVMPPEEYTLFSSKGYFTIRRVNEFWSGNFSDQTIEQFLMRMLKTSGGMTHGRGITDSTLTKWVHALPYCVPVCDALEKFTGVHSTTSEQH